MPPLTPPGPPAGAPVAGPAVQWQGAQPDPGPYAEPARPGVHWALVLVGIPIGFVAWVVGSFAIIGVTGALASEGSSSPTQALAVRVLLLLASGGRIVWRRTRRLWQGFVLGAAIGLVVAGGLCIPIVSSF